MRLEVEESAFLRARDGKPSQFLIWPKDFPQAYFEKMVINQSYDTKCALENDGVKLFEGQIFAKRRRQSSSEDVIVLMLPDCDLGKLPPTVTIELDVAMLD